MPDTLKLLGENTSPAGNAAEPLRADAPGVHLGPVRSAPGEASSPHDGERTDASVRAAVDKGHRPAGRRFQLFTPPSLECDDDAEPASESRAQRSHVTLATRTARAAVSYRSVVVALALAASAGLAVAAFLVLAFGTRPIASTPTAASSSQEATYQGPLSEASSAAVAASAAAFLADLPTAASSNLTAPAPSRAAPAATPRGPTRQPPSATPAVAPGPAPIAPLEPPF